MDASALALAPLPGTAGLQCISGLVVVPPTRLIGAVTGQLLPFVGTALGFPIPIRQVPGRAVRGTPLAQLNAEFATLCGRLVFDGNQFIFEVIFASPSPAALF